jgi:hypothetical protein
MVPSSSNGINQVCAFAINVNPPLTNPLLGCRSVTVPSLPPIGVVDSVRISGSTAVVTGWTLDPNRSGLSIPVQIAVWNGASNTVNTFTADDERPDVNQALGVSGRHGFARSVQVTAGTTSICAAGIGEHGNDAQVGCLSAQTAQPPSTSQPPTPPSTDPATTDEPCPTS